VQKRLPANIAVFQQLSFFSPAAVLSAKQVKFGQMPFIECVKAEDLGEMEEQWRQLRQVQQIFFSCNIHFLLDLCDM
jgi:hypothetical protein